MSVACEEQAVLKAMQQSEWHLDVLGREGRFNMMLQIIMSKRSRLDEKGKAKGARQQF